MCLMTGAAVLADDDALKRFGVHHMAVIASACGVATIVVVLLVLVAPFGERGQTGRAADATIGALALLDIHLHTYILPF